MMKPTDQILRATDDQLEIIQELAYAIWPSYYASIISMDQIEYMLRTLYSPDALRRQQQEGQEFYLVWLMEKPVGFIGLSPKSPTHLKLEKLYLLDGYRGHSLGRKMVDFAFHQTRQTNRKILALNVNRMNNSLGFYSHIGFKRVETVDIPYGPFWLNDFIMEKEVG